MAFERRSLVIKQPFKRWLKLTTDRAVFAEAVERGDAYSKQEREKMMKFPDSKKRRLSTNITRDSPPPARKRVRKRVSQEYRPPRTDEELAKRFKQVSTIFGIYLGKF